MLLDRFNSTALALNHSMTALQGLATDPRLKANVLATTQNIADTTATLAAMTKDLRTVTGNPQTQAQLRNTIANLDALMQKANSLLARTGWHEQRLRRRPRRDAGAGSEVPRPARALRRPPASRPEARANLHAKLAGLTRDLVAIQVRLSGLSPQHNPGLNPVLTPSRGPLGDINLVLLPHATTSVMVGANAIGNNTTWNAVLEQQKGNFHFGAGVLYSQIGVLGHTRRCAGWGSRRGSTISPTR